MSNEELAVLIQSGQRELLPELWQQVERFARWRADKLAGKLNGRCGIMAEDLYQCGYLALVSAVHSFCIEKEGSFLGWLDFYLKKEYAALGGWLTERQKNDPLNNAVSLDVSVDAENEDSSTLGELQSDPVAEEAFLDIEEQDRIQRLHSVIETLLQEMPEHPKTDQRNYPNSLVCQLIFVLLNLVIVYRIFQLLSGALLHHP